jgi:hypothetical protein
MSLHLRQIALVASRLAPAIEDLSAIFAIEPCYVDPGVGIWGLENTLMPVGSNFLEVVSPIKDGTAAGRYIARRGGDGGYMVICQTESRDSQHAFRERAIAAGVRVPYEGDREGFRIMQLHPGDLEAAFLEIDWDIESDFTGRWEPAGGANWKSFVRTERVRGFSGVELQCADPAALAAKWAHVADLPVTASDGIPSVQLGNASLRFVMIADSRGPGLRGVDVIVNDRDAIVREARRRGCPVADDHVMVCGTRFYLR